MNLKDLQTASELELVTVSARIPKEYRIFLDENKVSPTILINTAIEELMEQKKGRMKNE